MATGRQWLANGFAVSARSLTSAAGSLSEPKSVIPNGQDGWNRDVGYGKLR